MSISARKLKNGKTVYDVRIMRDGVRTSYTCQTKAEAKRTEALMIANKPKNLLTLKQYIDNRYWPVATKRLAATSLDTYEKEIRLRINPFLGDLYITEIDREAIQRMIDGCKSSSVARKAHGTLKTILNECVGDGIIDRNPAIATFAFPKNGRKRDNGVVVNSFDEIDEIMDVVLQDANMNLKKLAFLGLYQGLRPEERYALNWSDIDDHKWTIRVKSAYVSASRKHGGNQLKDTKTDLSTRIIPIHPRFKDWLLFEPMERKGYFLKNIGGGRFSPSTAQKQWKKFLLEHPDIPQVTLENMRHSFATSFLHDGGNIETLSRILGHARISTTLDKYVKPDTAALAEEMAKIGAVWQYDYENPW